MPTTTPASSAISSPRSGADEVITGSRGNRLRGASPACRGPPHRPGGARAVHPCLRGQCRHPAAASRRPSCAARRSHRQRRRRRSHPSATGPASSQMNEDTLATEAAARTETWVSSSVPTPRPRQAELHHAARLGFIARGDPCVSDRSPSASARKWIGSPAASDSVDLELEVERLRRLAGLTDDVNTISIRRAQCTSNPVTVHSLMQHSV